MLKTTAYLFWVSLMNRKFRRTAFIWNRNLYKCLYHHFLSISLLNKSIHFHNLPHLIFLIIIIISITLFQINAESEIILKLDLYIHQIIQKRKYSTPLVFSLNIDNNKTVSWAANQHIKMISEGSCDTEDWSNDVENLTYHRNKLHFKIYLNKSSYFK